VITLLAIPLSLVAAIVVLHERGETINTMLLAGLVIAVGVVVDDAIIDVENIVRRLRQHRLEGSTRSTASIVLEASLEVRRSIVYATLIILLAVLPVVVLEGLSGAFFKPMALSFALAVFASMGVALTVTPALALILLGRAPLERRESPLVRVLKRGYDAVLGRVLHRTAPALGVVALVAVLGVAVAPRLQESLFPEFKERDFLMHWVSKPGTSHDEEVRIVTRASRELRQIPGVRNFGSHIGQAFLADEIAGVNFGENWISVAPDADYDKTVAAIQEVVDGYPGLHRDVQTYLRERVDEVLTGSSEPIVIRISGDDLNVLRETADRLKDSMEGIEGIADLHVELQELVPQVEVEVDLAAARQFGVKPGDVRRAAGTFMASEEVGDIFRGGKAYDVHVWSTPETRNSLTSVKQLPLDTPGGGRVLLGEVADIRITPTPNVIKRENLTRRIDVNANVRGRALGAVAADVQKAMREMTLPQGYRAELIGEYAERQAAQERLLVFAIAAALGIFFLLIAAFGSWRLGLLAFLTLPIALVGGVLAAYIGSGVISLGSVVGFLTVYGIAARNTIMLINHYQHLEQHEGETFGPALVLRGARERLAPILMTASACGLAIVPLVVLGDIPGHEIEHPMAVVILGGLVTSTLLNLFVVPSLYLRFAKPAAPAAVSTPPPAAA
jgi:Cu/Ag efflux pump CusA